MRHPKLPGLLLLAGAIALTGCTDSDSNAVAAGSSNGQSRGILADRVPRSDDHLGVREADRSRSEALESVGVVPRELVGVRQSPLYRVLTRPCCQREFGAHRPIGQLCLVTLAAPITSAWTKACR